MTFSEILAPKVNFHQRIFRAIPITVLFFFNIGIKEVFNIFNIYDIVTEGALILMVCVFFIFMLGSPQYSRLKLVIYLFYFYLVISGLSSSDPPYGLQKAFLGLMTPLLCFEVFSKSKRTDQAVVDGLVLTVLLINIIAIPYKLRYGFFIRAVNFGVLGPITFGWLNGMAFLVLILQRKKSLLKSFLSLSFFLSILWTGSKGPLIASVLIIIFAYKRVIGEKLKSKILVFIGFLGIVLFLSIYGNEIRSIRSLMAYAEAGSGTQVASTQSINIRQFYLERSHALFVENPLFGVGFGGWNNSNLVDHKYPHNLIYEVLAELGVIGLIFLVLLLIFFKYNTLLGYVGLFGIIALMFSGDFSYLRYALLPLLFSYYFHNKKNGELVVY